MSDEQTLSDLPKAKPSPPPVQQWEYMSIYHPMGTFPLDKANALGASGWEMCGATVNWWGFKRPLAPKP